MSRGGEKRGLSNAAIGVLVAALVAVGSYLAFTKELPWGGGTEYQAVFNSAQNLRFDSPVRIAGVEVGKVTEVEPLSPDQAEEAGTDDDEPQDPSGPTAGGAALVTMEIDDAGLPLKEDAQFTLRPRLFLEGNLFVDVQPGSPGAPEADPADAFPPDQTTNTVQLDQILTSLQSNTRRDLQIFLDQFGEALIDADGAKSFRTLYKSSAGAFRYTAEVNEAILGENPHDLSGLIRNLGKVVRGLGRNEVALQDTVTNFRIVSGSFAAEDAALERAVIELPRVLEAADPAFENLNESFPPLRAFSREILPGVRNAPPMLQAATPLLRQVRLLSRRSELRGLARDLVPAVPPLARLAKRTPDFLEETRELASCFNQVIIPWSLDEVEATTPYPFPAVGRVFEETAYGLAGIAGESRSGDANGQYIRVAGGGGTNTITTVGEAGNTMAGVTQFPIDGAMPGRGSSARTPFRPNAPCENQEPPDLRAAGGGPPPNQSEPGGLPLPDLPIPIAGQNASGETGEIIDASTEVFKAIKQFGESKSEGDGDAARESRRDVNQAVKRFYREFGD
jgi:phospholipid/cholesterol/gamma-HCH transport system substrate-binding protein